MSILEISRRTSRSVTSPDASAEDVERRLREAEEERRRVSQAKIDALKRPRSTKEPRKKRNNLAPVKKLVNDAEYLKKQGINAAGNVVRRATGQETKTVEQDQTAKFISSATNVKGVATTGVAARFVEDIFETAGLVKDAITPGNDDSRNPFSPEYVAAEFNTGIFEPQSGFGKGAQKMATFFLGYAGVKKAIGTGAIKAGAKAPSFGSWLVNQAGKEGLASLVSTVITTDKNAEDGKTLANTIGELVGEENAWPVIRALSVDDEDSPAMVLAKNALEDIGMSFASEVVGAIFWGRKAYQMALKNRIPEKEAKRIAGDIFDGKMKQGLEESTMKAQDEKVRLVDAALEKQEQIAYEQMTIDFDGFDSQLDQGRQLDLMNPGEVPVEKAAAKGAKEASKVGPEGAAKAAGDAPTPKQAEAPSTATEGPSGAPKTQEQLNQEGDDILAGMRNPEAALQRKRKKEKLEALQRANDEAIDNPSTSTDVRALPQERSSTQSTVNPNKASFERGSVAPLMTDAQVKYMGMDQAELAGFDKLYEKFDPEEMARYNRIGIDQLWGETSAEWIDILQKDDGIGSKLLTEARARGLVESTPDGERFVAGIYDQKAVILGRVMMKSMAERTAQLSEMLTKLGPGNDPGNLIDRMLDNWKGVAQVYKNTTMTMGRSMASQKFSLDGPTGAYQMGKFLRRGDDQAVSQADTVINKLTEIQDLHQAGLLKQRDKEIKALNLAVRMADGNGAKLLEFGKAMAELGTTQYFNYMASVIFGGYSLVRNVVGGVNQIGVSLSSSMLGSPALRQAGLAGFASLNSGFNSGARGFAHVLSNMGSGKAAEEFAMLANTPKFIEQMKRSEHLLSWAKMQAEQAGGSKLIAYKAVEAQHRLNVLPIVSYTHYGLAAGDEMFKHVALHRELKMFGAWWAAKQAQAGKKVPGQDEIYEALVGNLKIDGLPSMIKKQGDHIWFEDDMLRNMMDESVFMEKPWQAVTAFSHFIDAVPFLRNFAMAVRTPMNLTKQAFAYLPGIHRLAYTDYMDVMKQAELPGAAGELARYRKEIIEAKATTGAFMGITAIASSAVFANITGAVLTEEQRQLNVPKFSWKAPGSDTWVSYREFAPLTIPLSFYADAGAILRTAPEAFEDGGMQRFFYEAAPAMATALGEGLFAGVPVQGMENLLNTLSLGNANPYETDPMQSLGASLLTVAPKAPFTSLAGLARQMSTPDRTTWDSSVHRELAKVTWGISEAMGLGESEAVPSFITGEGRENQWGGGQAINPARIQQEVLDPLLRELTEEGFIERDITRGPNSVKLTPSRRKRVHELMHQMGVREMLAGIIDSEDYQMNKAQNEALAWSPMDGGKTPGHLLMLNAGANEIKKRALRVLAEEDAEFAATLQAHNEREKARKGEAGTRTQAIKQISELLDAAN